MSTIFKVTGKNSGKDVSVTITEKLNGQAGTQINAAQLFIMTHFEVESDYSMWETKSIINNGECFYESLPHGSKCMLKGARTNSALEDMESSYRRNSNNGIDVTYTIQYQTVNRNGTINTRALVNCKPHNWKLGGYNPDQDVAQGVDFVSGGINDNGTGSGLFGS